MPKVQEIINQYKNKVNLIKLTDIKKTRQSTITQSLFDVERFPYISDMAVVDFTISEDILYILVNDLTIIKY